MNYSKRKAILSLQLIGKDLFDEFFVFKALDLLMPITDNDFNNITDIIIDKNNMMFGYIDQTKAVEIFNTDTTELKEISEAAGFIMEINIQLNDNPVKKNLIKTNEDKLGIDYLLPFKKMIKEFEQTGKTEILNNKQLLL